jgi:hypothetical protein
MYPHEQLEDLKKYCSKLSAFTEGGVTFLYLEELRLPEGCTPGVCDALLCPVNRGDGYPSKLFFPAQISSLRSQNWNVTNAYIGGKNWWAYSWRVDLINPTLVQILTEHLTAFTRIP